MSCEMCGAACHGDRCVGCEQIAISEAAAERALAARDEEGGEADGS